MKKTPKTLITAVALTAAALNPNSIELVSSSTIELMMILYGPGPAQVGDVNEDRDINILDYCLMLYSTNSNEVSSVKDISDINKDGVIDISDFNSLRNYLLGKTYKVVPNIKEPEIVSTITETVTTVEEPMQMDYGCFIATDPDKTE